MIRYYANKVISYITYKLLLKEVNGLINVPKKGGVIVAANHTSYLDIPMMYVALLNKIGRPIRFLSKRELLKDTFFRAFTFLFEYKMNKVIIIDRENPEKNALNEAINALKNGEVIGIYPEGTRSLTGKLQRARTGVARLALAAKVPVIPIGIKGTFRLMPTNTSLPKIKKIVKLNLGKPMHFEKYYDKKINKKILEDITRKIMKEIAKLTGQKYSY